MRVQKTNEFVDGVQGRRKVGIPVAHQLGQPVDGGNHPALHGVSLAAVVRQQQRVNPSVGLLCQLFEHLRGRIGAAVVYEEQSNITACGDEPDERACIQTQRFVVAGDDEL